MRLIKQSTKSLFGLFGYDIISKKNRYPFADIQAILGSNSPLTIFDVGAHHGQTYKQLRSIFPKSQIYSFEPFPESYLHLKSALSTDLSAEAINKALSNSEGIHNFQQNLSSATNSLLKTDAKANHTWGAEYCSTQDVIRVETDTIDHFLDKRSISKIDLLKLDVQGAEYLVMEGAQKACSKGSIRLVYTEVIMQPTYEKQMRLDDALSIFYERGFDLFNIYNPCFTNSGRLCQVDAIFTMTK
jgi:FkbM family methyltransferase